jgi:hypothetical protein
LLLLMAKGSSRKRRISAVDATTTDDDRPPSPSSSTGVAKGARRVSTGTAWTPAKDSLKISLKLPVKRRETADERRHNILKIRLTRRPSMKADEGNNRAGVPVSSSTQDDSGRELDEVRASHEGGGGGGADDDEEEEEDDESVTEDIGGVRTHSRRPHAKDLYQAMYDCLQVFAR